MKFEVGKTYRNGKARQKCLAVVVSSLHGPYILFENVGQYSVWGTYFQDIERGAHGLFKEYQEPTKMLLVWYKMSNGKVSCWPAEPNLHKGLAVGGLWGRNTIVKLEEVSYTEEN